MTQIIIDVRSKLEYKLGHVKDAINIPVQSIGDSEKLADIGKNDEIIVYCASGGRSAMAAHMLTSKGYKNIKNGINKAQTEKLLGR
jgi:rhodanese-related sulfurtransferase